MAVPYIFATTQGGDVPASKIDANFAYLFSLMGGTMTDLALTAVAVETSTIGNNTIVTGVPLKRISVHKAFLALASQTTVAFKSGVGTTLMGPLPTTGLVWDADANPYVITAIGEDLTLVLGTGVQTGGALYYKLVD